ncbi:Threonine/homoserine/homoserine lactone efflux protein [Dyella jiangningensis]|uniref:LysE family translocator n=1 Tax=Dyella sp. AtDHG13 TaxID=1938897 RepID=UPI00088D1967|nr:LysE family translocator [Dyella sp. AtDHG13]PXV59016.1 threonine/homoserine/homoserine lactone efflux protein [Dyella sp. AtDHG13]SDL29482.1 Threonine/homoserine/homoserine lactone efflux protein [Dyella jiangningensis]
MHTLLLFVATVLPLIGVPGPDMLYIASQAISGDARAGLRATAGVCAGYVLHSLLVALGLAAVIAASPVLFHALRWAGVAYLIYLAARLLRSAMRPGRLALSHARTTSQLRRGFLTAALNPKGMMIYFALLPQFVQPGHAVALQAMLLSAVFIVLCALVYSALSVALARTGKAGGLSDRRRRCVEGVSGGLLLAAAARLAST